MITSLPPLEAFRRDTVHLSSQDQTPARPAAWLSAAILLHRWSESSESEQAELRAALEGTLEQTIIADGRETQRNERLVMFANRPERGCPSHRRVCGVRRRGLRKLEQLVGRLVPAGLQFDRAG